jgi:hypothetical protein
MKFKVTSMNRKAYPYGHLTQFLSIFVNVEVIGEKFLKRK